jgi:hypothetical protein
MGAYISGTKIFQDTGLEQAAYDLPGWIHIFNKNFDLLNRALLRIDGLVDVDASALANGGVLTWNSTKSKWEVKFY